MKRAAIFRSMEYRLAAYLCLLTASAAAAAVLIAAGKALLYVPASALAVFSAYKLVTCHRRMNGRLAILLSAIKNGDYSFRYPEDGVPKNEREANRTLNRIKEILARTRTETAENEKFLAIIMESVSSGIIIADTKGFVISANLPARRMLGLDIFTHLKQLSAIDSRLAEEFSEMEPGRDMQISIANEREEMQISVGVSEVTLKKGTMRIFTMSSIGNELESREMESWIKLIRVLTHEIMNSAAPIISVSDTLLSSAACDAADDVSRKDVKEGLETINLTARSLTSFVESYRRFSSVPEPSRTDFALRPLAEKTMTLMGRELEAKGITADIRIAPGTYLNADPAQIAQVLLNLVKNAAESFAAGKGGNIVVSASDTGGRMRIDVANDGEPVPAEIAPHIFVPFFTTKDRGSGIGLSISRYIMRLHGGNLKHHAAGGMTVFSMVF